MRLPKSLLLAAVVIAALDYMTTVVGLHAGYTESNPVVAVVIDNFGNFGMLVMKVLLTVFVIKMLQQARASVRVSTLILVVIPSIAVVNNLILITR